MCGICGIYDFDQQPPDRDLVRRMNAVITHRGPDEDGYHFDGPAGLGMRRLSIIDLAGGTQPVFNEDRSIAILFNGEIYGYLELRDELQRLGHRFVTRSDTETIVHAYEEYGAGCVDHLVGMFAFAIWDSRKRELFIARDRLGEKPLFYTRVGSQFLFASEIKSLLQHPGCSRQVNEEALTHYLSTMWISYPLTIFRDIHQLPPGHWMRVSEPRRSPSGNGVEIQRYWFPENLRPRRVAVDEAVDEFRALFADAVRIQMRSDVPVGASLSAGMDSTSVVAYAARTTQDARLKTFAVGFEGADWDERAGARLISEMYGTQHFDITVSPADVRRLLPRLVWHMDEPMGDGSIVPVHMVSRLARQHVTVLLNGAGGDELFGGYPRYLIGRVPRPQRWIKSIVPDAVRKAAASAGSRYSWGLGNRIDVALRGVDEHYYKDTIWFRDDERRALTGRNGDAFASTVKRHYRRLPWADPINRLMFVDMNTYLSDDLLVQTDRMPMGVSLEGRLPFLDHRLVEWAMTLPGEVKMHDGATKHFLRRAMSHLLPAEILQRPKRGFGPPFGAWLQAGLLDVTRRMLFDARGRGRGLYDARAAIELLNADLGEHRNAQRIWMLLVLETWFRIYIDNQATSVPEGGLDELL